MAALAAGAAMAVPMQAEAAGCFVCDETGCHIDVPCRTLSLIGGICDLICDVIETEGG